MGCSSLGVRGSRGALAVAALATFAAPAVAEATVVRLGASAQAWFVARPFVFTLDVQVGHRFAPAFEAGGRVGLALFLSGPAGFGLPMDIYARATVGDRLKLYFELAGGPWVAVGAPIPLIMGHGEFGLGLTAGRVSFGPLVGWLYDSYLAGIRLGGRF